MSNLTKGDPVIEAFLSLISELAALNSKNWEALGTHGVKKQIDYLIHTALQTSI